MDDEETLALAQQMVDSFKAGLGDPFDLWQNPPVMDSSDEDEDEWNPNGGLPYFPRRKINRRVANALTMIATTLGQLEADQYAEERRIRAERYVPWPHMRLAMQAVVAQIVVVGAQKKSMERDELGPALHRFCYVQVKYVYRASRTTSQKKLNGFIAVIRFIWLQKTATSRWFMSPRPTGCSFATEIDFFSYFISFFICQITETCFTLNHDDR
jgi:hypothetical protein